MTKTVLVVDDDPDILTLVRYNLAKEGFKVISSEKGEEALEKARKQKPDLVILDLMLPGMEGLEVCRSLRRDTETRSIPILMLTAKGEETDVVVGLEVGADDYLVKPFSPKVLVARSKALLRRREKTEPLETKILMGPFSMDQERKEVLLNSKALRLTETEFNLLRCLAERPGRVFSRDELLNRAWTEGTVVIDRTVDVHILSLRKKLGKYAGVIETVRGFGYRFQEMALESKPR